MTPRRIVIRVGAAVVMLLALGGPTPGYVGNCSAGGPSTVDRVRFCTDKQSYICARDLAAMRIDHPQYDVCSSRIDGMCAGFNFPAGCAPTQELANACIQALSDMGRIGTPDAMIHECSSDALCGAAPLTSMDGI